MHAKHVKGREEAWGERERRRIREREAMAGLATRAGGRRGRDCDYMVTKNEKKKPWCLLVGVEKKTVDCSKSEVRSTNQKHQDEALDETNAAAPLEYASDTRLKLIAPRSCCCSWNRPEL